MAAPAEKTLRTLEGKWSLNKSISDEMGPLLALQGVGYAKRLAIGVASIDLVLKQYEGPPKPGNDSTDIFIHIDITQTALKVAKTEEFRCLDGVFRPHTDSIFGSVDGRSTWVTLDDEGLAGPEGEFLKKGWLEEGDGKFIMTEAKSTSNGWVAKQIWGFKEKDGVRRYARNIVVTKGEEAAKIVLYYNYDGPV